MLSYHCWMLSCLVPSNIPDTGLLNYTILLRTCVEQIVCDAMLYVGGKNRQLKRLLFIETSTLLFRQNLLERLVEEEDVTELVLESPRFEHLESVSSISLSKSFVFMVESSMTERAFSTP